MDVIVVESPAKAKTIEKYLGPGYTVLASFGHVRDLPAKDGSVRPDEDFAMSWAVDAKAEKRLNDIARAVRGARHLYLATDPDREGEAISWHVRDILKDKRALETLPAQMRQLERDIAEARARLADPGLYARDAAAFNALAARLRQMETDLSAAEEQWLRLEMLREELESAS